MLGRRHHAAHSINRKLLDDAIDRGGEELELRSLLRLHEIAAQAGGLALRFRKVVEQLALEFGHGLRASFDDRRQRGFGSLSRLF